MKIENDLIEFTSDDFVDFSDPVKKALEGYLDDYVAFFTTTLNAYIPSSKQHAKNLAAKDAPVDEVLESYAAADEAKRASAEPFITDLVNHLKS